VNTLALAPAPRGSASATLEQCLLLAALLHLWLVVALGSAPPGTAAPGQGVWGSINVTLRGPAAGPPAEVQPPAPPLQPSGPAGTAPDPRWGGVVREPAAPAVAAPELPGAARLGQWAAQPAAPAPPPLASLPALAPAATLSPFPPLPDLAPLPPPPPGRVLEERAAPLPPPPPPEPPAPPAERRFEAPAVRPAATAVAPLPRLDAVTSAVPPAALPALAPALAEPLPEPGPAPVEAPAPVLRQLGSALPAAATSTAAPLARQELLSVPAALPGLPTAGPPLAAPLAPDAGPRLGHDVATVPSAPASAPRLNLELPRARGGQLSRHGSTGALPVLPRPPDLPDKLGQDIGKAARDDCRKAYEGMGVLAVLPLAVDALRKDGCKW